MGTARMGRDPKTSVLNSHNQVWDALNVFVTTALHDLERLSNPRSRTEGHARRGFCRERLNRRNL